MGKPNEPNFFVDFMEKNCQSSNTKSWMQFMADVDDTFNVFDYHKTECIFEIMILGTLTEYWGKSIGQHLCKYSIELAQELKHTSIMGPQAVLAVFTSKFAQRIGDTLNFKTHAKLYYNDYMFNGISFADRIPYSESLNICTLAL